MAEQIKLNQTEPTVTHAVASTATDYCWVSWLYLEITHHAMKLQLDEFDQLRPT